MSKFESKYHHDESDRNKTRKYSDYATNYSSENCDLSQKMKCLEMEGLKLRSQVESILLETNEDLTSRTCETMNDCETININIEKLPRYEPHFTREEGNKYTHKSHEPKLTRDYKTGDNVKELHKELEEYKEKLDVMHQKLKKESHNHQVEKEQLVLSIENLKKINVKLQTNNDCQFEELKAKERKQESMIECLKSNLNQLLNVNKDQEGLLVESRKRLTALERVPTALKAFDNLRNLLLDIECYRGSDYGKDNDLESGSPHVIVEVVDRYFKDFSADIDDKSRKIRHLEDEMVQMKRNVLHDKEKSMLELRNQLAFYEEQNNYLKQHISEITDNDDHEMSRMKEEILMLKSKLDHEMSSATSVIDGLENNIQKLSNKLKRENENWILEKKSLEKLYDESDKQLTIIRVERDQAINQKSSVLAKLDAAQTKLNETETQLLQLQSDKFSLEKQIDISSKRNKAVESSLSYTRVYLENITKSIRQSSFKGDCSESNNNELNNLTDVDYFEEESIPWRPRKYDFEEILHQINLMNKEKNESIEKFEQMKKELEVMEKEFDSNKIEKKRLEQTVKTQQLEIESFRNETSHINSLIGNRNGEIERLTAERDYYFQMLNEKTEDLANVKTEKHRLVVMLEERCRQLELQNNVNSHKHQNNENCQSNIIDTSSSKNQILREERTRLASQLNEMQKARDELLTNHKDQTECLEQIRSENMHLQIELKNLYRDYDEIFNENKRLLLKLKDSESDSSNLGQQLHHFKESKSRKHLSLEKKISDLNAELSSCKNELKIALSEIRTFEKGGLKTHQTSQLPIVLNEYSKSSPKIDPIKLAKNRLNALEQQMNTIQTNNQNVKEENNKLTDLLRKVTNQNDRMAEELENYIEENKNLRNKLNGKYLDDKDKKVKSNKCQIKNNYSNHSFEKRNFTDRSGMKHNNGESIHKLREDLQESIKDAKKLLTSKTLQNTNDSHLKHQKTSCIYSGNIITRQDNKDLRRQRSLSDHDDNIMYSNFNNNCSGSDNIDSSAINTKRSESMSLTEVDRHLNLPQIKKNDKDKKSGKRTSSPVEKLLSSDNKSQSGRHKRSHQSSYELEEKIKHLLMTET